MINRLARVLIATAIACPSIAIAQDALKLGMESFTEVVTTAKDGTTETKRVAAVRVLPGDEVIYVITYQNTGTKPITGAVINNPLPKLVNYQAGSATGAGADLLVSVDGGTEFGVLTSLKVTDPDGTERPARADDVTHLRWTVAGSIAPGAEGTVSYRAALK